MLKEGFYILSTMNIKYWVLVCILGLGIVFLGLDKCSSSRKADELKGQYKEASRIAKVERMIKEEIIKEQKEKITEAESTIATINKNVAKKDRSIAELSDDVLNLELKYRTLNDKDEKIDNLAKQVEAWKGKFDISQSIISDKDAIIFQLSKKYEFQVRISLEYKSMGETSQGLLAIRNTQVRELEKINKRLRLGSGLKTGIVVTMAAIVAYSLLKD